MVARVFKDFCVLAAIGSLLAACSKMEESRPSEMAPKDHAITVTTTLSLCGEQSKALSGDGVKTFAAGDQVAVIYTNTSNQTVKATSAALKGGDFSGEGKTAQFTVTLTNPKSGTVDYVYPASMVTEDGSMASISLQDGTLETLSSKYDYARGSGQMTVSGSDVTLPSGVTLSNPLVICKFTLKNESADVTSGITAFTITSGDSSYNINRAASPGPIYVAIQPVSGATIKFAATNGSSYYGKEVSGKTLEAGKMYPITLDMGSGSGFISYVRRSWDAGTKMVTSETVVESAKRLTSDASSEYGALSGTWYVSGELNIASYSLKAAPGATLNLVLCDGAHLSTKGIWVGNTGTLRIFAQTAGTGQATVSSENRKAAIGLESDYDGGTVEIHGGIINASCSENYGAGIGSTVDRYMSRIVIYDGTITAKGGMTAAGIGRSDGGSDGGVIDIYGGKITAKGGASYISSTTGDKNGGSGIGDGNSGKGKATEAINIYGGTIEANGGSVAAGIGAGNGEKSSGSVHIYGGNISATGGANAAGITGKTIEIQGGDVSAYAGEDGAGIGGGLKIDNGTINISGGTVRAYGDQDNSYGAGIGGGKDASGGTITISGGTVYAYGGIDAAGIGSGEEGVIVSNTNSGNITISGGYVYAVGKSYGAGIGAGEYSDCLTVTINTTSGNPLTVEAIGGADCGSAGSIGSYSSDRFGTLNIGNLVKVQTYDSGWTTLQTNVNRADQTHHTRHAKLTTCDHAGYTADTCLYCTH